MVKSSGLLPTVLNSPRGSSIRVNLRHPKLLMSGNHYDMLQERRCKLSSSTLLSHIAVTSVSNTVDSPRRRPKEIHSC